MDSPETERQLKENEKAVEESTIVSVCQDHSDTTSGFAENTGINELQSVLL
jgi:hypothetical protein